MKIRRYIGKTTQEAILKVKMDLGSEAVILNTRKIRQPGFLKIFSKPLIEVLAAIDEDAKKPIAQMETSSSKEENTVNNNVKQADNAPIKDDRMINLEGKVSDLEGMIRKIYFQVSNNGKEDTPEKQKSKVTELFNNTLLKNEVEPEVVEKILMDIREKLGTDINMNDMATAIYGIITGLIGNSEPIAITEKKPYKAIFIGPTGVGKTTTIAKLAADFLLNKKKTVGLVTADTYRIAAVDQLKTYAEILNVPVSVVYSASEIKNEVERLTDKDVILIDTAGRSHRKKNQIEELKKVVELAEADEVFLVVSANTRVRDFKEIIDTYGFLPNYKIIVTKIDETNSVGNILNIRYYSNKPLSYITTGQSVPDDIEILNVDKITRCIMGSMRYDGSS